MSRQTFYCSELSRRVAEKSYGTASVGVVWLLIEYPHAWGPRALEDSALSPAVKRHLRRAVRAIPRARVLFIKQGRAPHGRPALFVARSRENAPEIARFELDSYEQLLGMDIAAVAAGDSTGAFITREPLFLICTHGRRDKCCAKYGYSLYKSLREEFGASVWQSSHVGGDRFAANLVCFPHGLFYAHVTREGGRAIAGEYTEGHLVLEGYRGRACYGYAVQAAEFFIRRESGLRGLAELRFLGRERLGADSWRVQFVAAAEGRIHEARLTSRLSDFQNLITCHSTAEQRVTQYVLDDYRTMAAR
jgi:hypothetical protein